MAHDLCIRNGKASMFYVREAPWHGLGTKLAKPATAAQAIKAASLDYEVVKQPIIAVDAGFALPIPDKFAVVRRDMWGKTDCPVFGIVGKDYNVLQNSEAFEFFDPIVGKNAAIYETAGALGNGERVWILARLPDQVKVVKDDIDKYLLLSNSHDGTSSVQIKFTPIRVVCNNTLTLALSRGPTLRVAHTRDLRERLWQAEKMLHIVNTRFDGIGKAFQGMAKIQMDAQSLAQYLENVFPSPRDPDDEKAVEQARRHRSWAEYFFADGEGNKAAGVAGTLWAAYNGVTEYIDHRQTKQAAQDRLESVWFGSGYHAKARAYHLAEELVQTNNRAQQ